MAEYIKQEIGKLNGTDGTRCYYRMKSLGMITTKELVERIAAHGSALQEGTVVHVLTELARQMAYYMAKGYSVSLNEIGIFRASLGVMEGKEMDEFDTEETRRNARSIGVRRIRFRADKQLVKHTGEMCRLKRGKENRLKVSPHSKEERRLRALEYLKQHGFMRISDYVQLTGLSRTGATLELQEFRKMKGSGIGFEGRGPARIYVPAD